MRDLDREAEYAGEVARKVARFEDATKKAQAVTHQMSHEQIAGFVDNMEAGRKQADPQHQEVADVLRKTLDGVREEVRALGKGKLEEFNATYFPHEWLSPEGKAGGRGAMEGNKAWTKQRSVKTFKEGLERGLEPATWDPVDAVLKKVTAMTKYVEAHKTIEELKAKGHLEFHRIGDRIDPSLHVNDPAFSVYGPPTREMVEYHSAQVLAGLKSVANAMGIDHKRLANVGKGALGLSMRDTPHIKTQGGSPLSVLAHEIGHQLDDRLGLGKFLRNNVPAEEMDALSDMHGAQNRRNFDTDPERAATAFEGYVSARERMRDVAPAAVEAVERFIADHPDQLGGMGDVRPSLELDRLTYEKDIGGLMKLGEWVPRDAASARVLNAMLDPGLAAKYPAFKALQSTANTLNALQLGLSAFHLGFTSLDAAISRFAIGLRWAGEGKLGEAAKAIASTPLAPFTTAMKGSKLWREYVKPGSQGAELAKMADGVAMAGGRVQQSREYQMLAVKNMRKAFNETIGAFKNRDFLRAVAKGGETAVRSPFAALDAVSAPIMNYLVPMQKLGVFADMARFEVEKLGPGATSDETRAALGKAWDSVDNRMGQMVYENRFWNRTARDLTQIGIRSLGWNAGTWMEVGGGVVDAAKGAGSLAMGHGPEFTHKMAYTMSMPVVTGMVGAMLSYLFTGEGPKELKDYFFPRTGRKDKDGNEVRLSLPSYIKDIYEMAHAPGQTLANKVHPLVGTLAQMMANKDFFGTEIRHADDPIVKQALDLAKYVGKEALPFGLRNLAREDSKNASVAEKALGFVGVPRAPAVVTQTPAQRAAADYSGKHQDVGARTQEQADKARREREIAADIKSHKVGAWRELTTEQKAGRFTEADVENTARRATSKDSHLDYTVKHLPIDEAIDVWRVASPEERKTMTEMLREKLWAAKAITEAQRKAYLAELKAAH